MTIKFTKDMQKQLSSLLKNYIYYTGVNNSKNNRKKVKRGTLVNTTRGIATAKSKKKAKQTNVDVIQSLYKKKFYFYSQSFTKNNPNYSKFLNLTKYLFDSNPRKFENAITANVKAYLDLQTKKFNKPSTAREKKFNKFGIDSRQMQLSLDSEKTDKKTKSSLKLT